MSRGRTRAASGDRRWPVRGPIIAGVIAVLVLVGGFTVWAMSTRISGAVVAGGQVEVEQQRQIVQHPDGGVSRTSPHPRAAPSPRATFC